MIIINTQKGKYMKKNNLVITGVAILMLAACGSSEDVDAVAADMMTGEDAIAEKDARCMAKNLKKNASNDQWNMMVGQATGEIKDSDISFEDAMGMMVPLMAASVKCGVKLQ
jgi:hypothetical protein